MKKIDQRLGFWGTFLSGGIAGVTSRTFTSPLDVVKIVAQVGTAESQQGFLATFRNMYQAEGLRAFWKGNGVACLRLFPYNAIQFAAYTKLKVFFEANEKSGGSRAASSVKAMASGSLAGVVATIAVYPLDMAKTRLTVQHVAKSQAKYTGLLDLLRTVRKEEGLRALYNGMSTSILGVVPYAGGTFMAYDVLGRAWGKPKEELSPMQHFINGCLAGSFAQTFSFPFDTIRKKLQAQSLTVHEGMRPDVEFTGMIDAFRKTVAQNGVTGLWRGTTANLVKVAPFAGLTFATYEFCKHVFMKLNERSQTPVIASGNADNEEK